MKNAGKALQRFRIPAGKAAGLVGAVAAVGGIAWGAVNSIYSVNAGERAVMFNRVVGVKPGVVGEGTHFRVPWFDTPIIYDVRTRPHTIKSLTGSKDLQMVEISLRVLTRPDTRFLPKIFRTLGTDYDERVLPSIVNEVLKGVVAQYNAASLLTNRETVSLTIRRNLRERAKEFNIIMEDVSITELHFGHEFTQAVEAKQVAQQEAERAKYVVLKARQDKKSIIIKAQGEAKSAEMIGRSIQDNPGFVQLRKIDAAREIATTMARSANHVYLSADTLLLNVMDKPNGSSDDARQMS